MKNKSHAHKNGSCENSFDKDVEKLEHLCTVKSYNHSGKQFDHSSKN